MLASLAKLLDAMHDLFHIDVLVDMHDAQRVARLASLAVGHGIVLVAVGVLADG
jgi:hypothetical protein